MTSIFTIIEQDTAALNHERSRVRQILNPLVPQGLLHEVGSTAVPGVIGKEDLDFLVRVPLEEFTEYRGRLDSILLRNPDQLSTNIYQGYMIESEMDVAVQLTVAGGPHDTFLEFLELLRSDADRVTEYNELKLRFNGQPMELYRRAKGEFIHKVLDS